MTALISIRAIEKSFGGVRALGPIDLEVKAGERVGLIGPNGSGKTTLINCISGIVRPDAGAIFFGGQDITGAPAYRRARLGLSRSFQIPRPFVGMSVLENLLVPCDYLSRGGRAALERAEEVLSATGLIGRRYHPSEALSQLELRKLELARALVAEPQALVADEAMAGLSEGEIDEILALLFNLNARGVAVVMIEHIMHAVMRFSERMICLETGRIVADGSPSEVARDPNVRKVYFGEQTSR